MSRALYGGGSSSSSKEEEGKAAVYGARLLRAEIL
jgi:hypothetical protein